MKQRYLQTVLSLFHIVQVLFLIGFAVPLAVPALENIIIHIQFRFLLPCYFILGLHNLKLTNLVLLGFFAVLAVLVPFGLPGSILGWFGGFYFAYHFSLDKLSDTESIGRSLYAVSSLAIAFSVYILILNMISPFDHAQLSHYFAGSSINTIPILLVCLTNLLCAYYYYHTSVLKVGRDKFASEILLIVLLMVSVIATVIFEFRSGIGIFLLLLMVFFSKLKIKFTSAAALFSCLVGVTLVFFHEWLIAFIVPGRDSVWSVLEEISSGSLRLERLLIFWEKAAFAKQDFANWSEYFSFSAMSDFVAAFFPLSLFFFLPCISLLKLLLRSGSRGLFASTIILVSAASSLLISVMQPDFFALMSFFIIVFTVYHGEKVRKRWGDFRTFKSCNSSMN